MQPNENLKSIWWNVWKKTCNGCQPSFGTDNKITSLPARISLIGIWFQVFLGIPRYFPVGIIPHFWNLIFQVLSDLICDFLDWFEFHLTHRILTNRPMSRFSRTWGKKARHAWTPEPDAQNQFSHLILSNISGIYYHLKRKANHSVMEWTISLYLAIRRLSDPWFHDYTCSIHTCSIHTSRYIWMLIPDQKHGPDNSGPAVRASLTICLKWLL